jgi:hypothetical protein
MKQYKPHSKDNKPEDRFNKIIDHYISWQWENNSIVRLGGHWASRNICIGSRLSIWNSTCSDYYNYNSPRGITNQTI